MAARKRVSVSGRVQGVFFRDTCAREAARHGVVGWVRNTSDGRVEACFEGDEAAVDAMVQWCRSGPSRAEVTDLDVVDEAPRGESAFRVR